MTNKILFLTASKGTKLFHESRLVHGWIEAWCRYLDYVVNIDISHQAPPEQRSRYTELNHFGYDSEEFNTKTMKARPEYKMAASAIRSVNQEEGLTPQIMLKSNTARDDLDPQKRNWLIW